MKDDPNCVCETNGEIEAQQIKALLRAHDIPSELKGEALRHVHGFTLNGLGMVRICVPPHLVEKARDLLARAEAGELALPDTDGPDEPGERT